MTLGWVALLLLVTLTGLDAACEGDPPTAAILCHVETSVHPSTNPCLCTHMVVHDKDVLKDVEILKVKNPKLKILTVEISSKSELSKGTDGLYVNLVKAPSKEELVEDLKALATKFDNIDSSKRAEAKYDEKEASNDKEIVVELPAEPQQLAKHYDLKALTKYVKYFVVPSYNLTDSSEEGLSYHPSRLMGVDDILNADSLVDLFAGMGADHSQMILSMPAYALRFSLKEESKNMPRSPVSSSPKKISQSELCKMVEEGGWTLERDEDLTAPYAYKGTDWVAFDDTTSASIKGKYVLLRNMGGVSIASAENDDWSHSCAGRPIIDTIHNTFTQLSRKSRAAQLLSLQDQIHNSLVPFSGDIQLSPFRIVRVVDRSGSVHVVRKEAKTEFECTRQGYFTHPSGCNRFYRCVKFNQYSSDFTVFEYDCPAGLAFDERYEVCVWPGSLPDASACKGSSEIAPVPRSRYACSTEGYYADPENCRWFFACLDHHRDGHTPPTAYEFRCPFGLVFDGNTLACDWPWKVPGCSSGGAAYASVNHASLYPGDILEGRLRPAYASVSDVHVSGGRIEGVDGGHVLGSTILSGLSSQSYGSSGYGAGYGSGNSDQSGAYVHDPTGDTGGEYIHQDVPYVHNEGEQRPYVHQEGLGSPYVHQSDSGAYIHQGDAGIYKHSGDGGAYIHQGDAGIYKHNGDSGAYIHQGDAGIYKHSGDSGAYVHQGDAGKYKYTGDSGAYVHQGDSGAYIHQGDSGNYKYVGDSNVYHGNKYAGGSSTYIQGNSGGYTGDSGAYVHQVDSGNYAGVSNIQGNKYSGSGAYFQGGQKYSGDSGAYIHQGDTGDSGAYIHQGDTGDSGAYLHQGNYRYGGAYSYDGSNKGTAYIRNDIGAGTYVSKDYASGVINGGLSSYDVKNGGAYSSVLTAGYGGIKSLNGGAYVHDTRGDYDVKTGGSYVSGIDSGAYIHDARGDFGGAYGYKGSYYGGKYVVGQGNQGYVNTLYQSANQYGSGAYVHDSRGDYGGAYKVSPINTYGIQVNQAHAYQPTAPIIHSYSPTKLSVQEHGYHSVNVAPITVTSSPVVPLKPVQYIQPQVRPVVVTTPAPQIVGYHYQQPSVASVSQKIQPIVLSTPAPPVYKPVSTYVSSTPVVPYNPVQYVSTPSPVVIKTEHIQPVSGYDYPKPSIKFDLPKPVVYEQNYVSTPAPSISVSYQQPFSTPSPISVSSTPIIPYNPVQYKPCPSCAVAQTAKPLTVTQTYYQPAIKLETPDFTYKKPYCSTCAKAQTGKPLTVTETPIAVDYHQTIIKDSQGYSYPKPAVRFELPVQHYVSTPAPPVVSYQQPIKTVTVRPITVSSTPAIPYSPVHYVKPVTQISYNYQPVESKPVVPVKTYVSTPAPPVVSYNYVKPEPVQTISVSTPAPPVVSYNYVKPEPVQTISVSTPAPVVSYNYEQPQVSYNYHPVIKSQVSPIVPVVTSKPVVPLNPVQYVKPIQQYSYQPVKPAQFSYNYVQPQPIAVSTPAPTYYQPTQTVRPIVPVVTSKPVIPLNPVQYVKQYYQPQPVQTISVSTPAPVVNYQPVKPVAQYSYVKPQPIAVSTPAPPVVHSYQQTVSPIVPVVTSKPVIPYNPVQYVSTPAPIYQTVKTGQQFSYSYVKPEPVQTIAVSTPAPPVVYNYETPKYRPVAVSTSAPVYNYQPVKPAQFNYNYVKPAPPVVHSYQQTVSPIVPVVTSKPVIPYDPVQYVSTPAPIYQTVKTGQQFSYNYVKEPVQPIAVSTPAPPVVSYNYETPKYRPVTVTTPAPVYNYQPVKPAQFSYNYVKPVSTPAPPVVHSYQQTVSPIVPVVTSKPVIPYNPVQYVSTPAPTYQTVKTGQQYSYSYVKEPVQPIAVSTPAPPVVSYNYETPKYKPVTVSTPAPVVYNYETPKPIAVSRPIVDYKYEAPNYKPIVPVVTSKPVVPLNPVQYVTTSAPSYSYQPTYSTTALPYESVHIKQEVKTYVKPQPFAVPAPVQQSVEYVKQSKPIFSFSYVRPETPEYKPVKASYNYEAKDYYEEKIPVTTQATYIEQKPQIAVQPDVGNAYFEEYFESKKNQDYSSKGQYFGSSFSTDGAYIEKPTKVKTGYNYENYGEVHSSSFAPIIVPEVSTVRPYKKPVQTYVNTVEEENYYTSSISPDLDENLNIHLDIPKIGVVHSTPEQIVQVTTVAPVRQRVRVNGASNGYYVRKQKVKVQPVVTTENYPTYFTTTVRPVYSSTIDLTSPTLVSTTIRPSTSTVAGAELDIDDDDRLIQQVSGGFGEIISSGDKGVLRQGVSSTTISSLKDGEAVVGVVKKDREPFTGRKRAKVVVVSRLSEFNPLLVGKLGAECKCKSEAKTLDLSKTRTRIVVPSRDYLPTSTTPLPAELTDFDYDDASPPTIEIKPVRKVQRVYTTTGIPVDVSSVEYETSTRPTRKISSSSTRKITDKESSSARKTDGNDIDCQRPGLFRHPHLCNKFYSCNWDEWKKRFTVSVFNCPIHLAFDSKLGACNWPSKGPKCSGNNLLV